MANDFPQFPVRRNWSLWRLFRWVLWGCALLVCMLFILLVALYVLLVYFPPEKMQAKVTEVRFALIPYLKTGAGQIAAPRTVRQKPDSVVQGPGVRIVLKTDLTQDELEQRFRQETSVASESRTEAFYFTCGEDVMLPVLVEPLAGQYELVVYLGGTSFGYNKTTSWRASVDKDLHEGGLLFPPLDHLRGKKLKCALERPSMLVDPVVSAPIALDMNAVIQKLESGLVRAEGKKQE